MNNKLENWELILLESTLSDIAHAFGSYDKGTCVDHDIMQSLQIIRKHINDIPINGKERFEKLIQ